MSVEEKQPTVIDLKNIVKKFLLLIQQRMQLIVQKNIIILISFAVRFIWQEK